MLSAALESFCASPLSNSCSFVSDFTFVFFNTCFTIKVTQIIVSIFFKKKTFLQGYLITDFVLTKINYITKKHTQMKKLLIVLAIGTFAACNSGTSSTTTDTTSTMSTDTGMGTMAPDTSSMMSMDTTHTDTSK